MFKKMASKTDSYQIMVSEINKQKKVTRDALSYVADIKRDRSIFSLKRESESKSSCTTKDIEVDDEKQLRREEQLKKLLSKSEIPEWSKQEFEGGTQRIL